MDFVFGPLPFVLQAVFFLWILETVNISNQRLIAEFCKMQINPARLPLNNKMHKKS